MASRAAFDIDCTAVIPECEFKCSKCIREIRTVLGKMQGVDRSYLEGEGEDVKFIVEHNPTVVAVEQLMDALKNLPSFYKGFFVPKLYEA